VWAVTVQREEKHGSGPRKPVNVPWSAPHISSLWGLARTMWGQPPRLSGRAKLGGGLAIQTSVAHASWCSKREHDAAEV
jgi:hypothetical protein